MTAILGNTVLFESRLTGVITTGIIKRVFERNESIYIVVGNGVTEEKTCISFNPNQAMEYYTN